MRRAALIAAFLLSAAAPSRAATKASAASIAKLQKLAGRVRGLKKGVVVVPARKAAAKVAAKASKAGKAAKSSAIRSNKVSRLTALRSLYRQMAALDYRSCRVSQAPKASRVRAQAGLRRLALLGERAALADDAELDDPDGDADLAQDCGVCPNGTIAAGDDLYGLCYCADPADLAAADAAVSSDTVSDSMDAAVSASSAAAASVAASSTAVSVAVSSASDAAAVPDFDTTISRLARVSKAFSRTLSQKSARKAAGKDALASDASLHYARGRVYERMAAAATRPAFPAVKIAKNGWPVLAGVPTSAKLRKLASRLASGQGAIRVAKPLSRGGFAAATMPRSQALRNAYTMMAALDLHAARVAGLPPQKDRLARNLYGKLANLSAGGRVMRKASRKARKASGRKAGVRVSDDEDGGDSGGGEVDMGVEPVVYVDNSGGGDAGYADTSSSSDSGYADTTSSSDSGYADTSSSDDSSYADSDSSGDSSDADSTPAPDPDAQAFSGSDDTSGFGDTGLGDSTENAVADNGDSTGAAASADDAAPAGDSGSDTSATSGDDQSSTAWGASDLADSNENAVNDPFVGTPLTDPGQQDAAPDNSAWADTGLDQSQENAVADNQQEAQGNGIVDPGEELKDGPNNDLTPEQEAQLKQQADAAANSIVSTWNQPDPIPDLPGQTLPQDDTLVPNPMTAMGEVMQSQTGPDSTHWSDIVDVPMLPGDVTPHEFCTDVGLCQNVLGWRLTDPPVRRPTPTPTTTETDPNDPNNYGPGWMHSMGFWGRVSKSKVACGPKSHVLRAAKAGLTFCGNPAPRTKVAGARKASKPLYSRLARWDRAAAKLSHGIADRQTTRSRKAGLLYARAQLYARMALAIPAGRPAARRAASRPQAKKAEKVASKASPKSSAKPAKPVVSDDVPAQPAPEQPAVEQPAPAAPAETQAPAQPSEDELLKKSEQEMDDMGKDMENQIRQRSGQ